MVQRVTTVKYKGVHWLQCGVPLKPPLFNRSWVYGIVESFPHISYDTRSGVGRRVSLLFLFKLAGRFINDEECGVVMIGIADSLLISWLFDCCQDGVMSMKAGENSLFGVDLFDASSPPVVLQRRGSSSSMVINLHYMK
ncbi:hypothetical protein LOK49_LG07G01822 [Camellia lanceoleosa]|uniref:Uncharacterized protein n=1 Tax=Camellia lanceoleosa TaxID=1840588 RepID=A0ACC0H1D5_9ERIC|nr:hypothetical protein LOK49_LG07G01822 [Camellia lanceoleosa]